MNYSDGFRVRVQGLEFRALVWAFWWGVYNPMALAPIVLDFLEIALFLHNLHAMNVNERELWLTLRRV